MGLGARHGNARRDICHDTVGLQAHGVRSALWADFSEGQRVQTVDGIPGVVAAVEDGPFPGAEQYIVTLDNDLGGGQYTASQLTALGPAQGSEVHTADLDYPELGSILTDRPDIARSARRHVAAEEGDVCDTCNRERDYSKLYFGAKGCPDCTLGQPYRVSVRNDQILLDGKPHTESGTQVYDRHSHGLPGDRYGAQFTHYRLSGPVVGAGRTKTEAAKKAVSAAAAEMGDVWEDRPDDWHQRLDGRRRDLHGDEDY